MTTASVLGADHARVGRNNQDAAAGWAEGRRGVAVVCDGCGSAPYSELGARVVARTLVAAMARRLRRGADPAREEPWAEARAELVATLGHLGRAWATQLAPPEEAPAPADVEAHLLCTVVAAAVTEERAAIWALGDGAFVLGGHLHVLGPFEDNAPPYLAYDLLGAPARARLVSCDAGEAGVALVATDGAAALGEELVELAAAPRYLEHPDALRRHLVMRARPTERILWDERRVERAVAALRDDASIALLGWEAS